MFCWVFHILQVANMSDEHTFSASGLCFVQLLPLLLALKPADLSKVLETVFEQARQLRKATESARARFSRAPNVTVSYLNTCGVYCQ